MQDESAAPAPVKCSYCHRHRWCHACKIACDLALETCGQCDGPLDPAPRADGYHEPCAKVAMVLRTHELFLAQVAGHAASAYEAALQRVVAKKFTGYLDVRVASDVGGVCIQSRVQFMLRGVKEPARKGWFPLWVSPELVQLMRPAPPLVEDKPALELVQDRAEPVVGVDPAAPEGDRTVVRFIRPGGEDVADVVTLPEGEPTT